MRLWIGTVQTLCSFYLGADLWNSDFKFYCEETKHKPYHNVSDSSP